MLHESTGYMYDMHMNLRNLLKSSVISSQIVDSDDSDKTSFSFALINPLGIEKLCEVR